MADELIYGNTPTNQVSPVAGVVTISIAAATYVSSVPCKECWIKTKAASSAIFNINTPASATAGWPLVDATPVSSVQGVCQIGPIPIANLSMINLYAAAACTVWILWRQ